MAQPNVVREPSMDEILASIRRIIESNEPITQAGVATAMAEPEGFVGHPANDDTEVVTLTVDDTFSDHDDEIEALTPASPVLRTLPETHAHAEAPVSQPEFRQPVAPVQQKPLSLADVAARVRAASERGFTGRDAPMPQPAVSQAPAPAPEPVVQPRAAAFIQPDVKAETKVENDFVESAAIAESQALPQTEPQASFVPEPAPVSLISSSTGEQVARSFQDLALAIDNAERRSLDQIAEDMLRPMLQEWLDDNLPTLVERLVREEIERVARGPRR
jgi:cell pole-organizing protein PopZ